MIQKLPDDAPKPAASLLNFTLVAIIGIGCLFALNMLQLDAFTGMFAIAFIIGLVGFGHYVFWGHDLSREVAQSREAFLRQQARDREEQERAQHQ